MQSSNLWDRVVMVARREGWRGIFARVWRRLVCILPAQVRPRDQAQCATDGTTLPERLHATPTPPPPANKTDVIGFFRFVLTEDVGTSSSRELIVDPKTINWIIPEFGIGSGGHLNIFRYVFLLEAMGYVNTLCLIGNHGFSSPLDAEKLICEHFFPVRARVVFGPEHLPPSFATLATEWRTAYALRGAKRTLHKMYFVQDFEAAFFAHGSEYAFAEDTYRFGYTGICAGDWLSSMLATRYGMRCHSVGFSYDKGLYHQSIRREPEIRRVFCYFRPPTVRRGLEMALLALDLVGRRLPDVKFIFAGWDMSSYHFPHEHLNAGSLSLAELPDLYSQCDIGLVISCTNLSLLPLEMMACGCVVVSNRGPNTEWLLNESNSALADLNPSAIANTIVTLMEDTERRHELAVRAKAFAETTSWERQAEKLASILVELGRQGPT